jgi:hypothetical protein
LKPLISAATVWEATWTGGGFVWCSAWQTAWPLAARAQQPAAMPVVGWIGIPSAGSYAGRVAAFREGPQVALGSLGNEAHGPEIEGAHDVGAVLDAAQCLADQDVIVYKKHERPAAGALGRPLYSP